MKEVFQIIPASGGALWFLGAIMALLLLGAAFAGWIAHSARHSAVEVSTDGLTLRTLFYGRKIPAAALEGEAARAVDLEAEPQLRPRWRTNGIGLPGYGSGWFKLENGTKALALITDSHRVVYIPTRRKFALLVSVTQPEALVEALRKMSPPPAAP